MEQSRRGPHTLMVSPLLCTNRQWSVHITTMFGVLHTGEYFLYRFIALLMLCSREQQWFASGSFDRTIKLWDLASISKAEPLLTLQPPEAAASKASIYALAVDPYGSMIASGSPERVVRMWDPRSGKRIAKLVGHTDNIRAILMSEDAKYVSASSSSA